MVDLESLMRIRLKATQISNPENLIDQQLDKKQREMSSTGMDRTILKIHVTGQRGNALPKLSSLVLSCSLLILLQRCLRLGKNIGMFLAFRFLAGCASSGPLTVGGGTVADVVPPAQRGKVMSLFFIGPLLGPVMGPIIGGFVSETIGWPWTFWVIITMAGISFVISIFFLRETNATVLLAWKASRLRKETANAALVSKMDRGQSPRQLFLRAITRPTKLLILSPIVLLLSLLCAFLFGLLFLLFKYRVSYGY